MYTTITKCFFLFALAMESQILTMSTPLKRPRNEKTPPRIHRRRFNSSQFPTPISMTDSITEDHRTPIDDISIPLEDTPTNMFPSSHELLLAERLLFESSRPTSPTSPESFVTRENFVISSQERNALLSIDAEETISTDNSIDSSTSSLSNSSPMLLNDQLYNQVPRRNLSPHSTPSHYSLLSGYSRIFDSTTSLASSIRSEDSSNSSHIRSTEFSPDREVAQTLFASALS